MSVRILQGDGEGDSQGAVLYCGTSNIAFGPVFEDAEYAQGFLDFWEARTKGARSGDPRQLSPAAMIKAVTQWREAGMPVAMNPAEFDE